MPYDLQLLVETLVDVSRLGHSLDLHDANFMMRWNQIVIIDPICSYDDLALNMGFNDFNQGILRDLENTKKANTKPLKTKNELWDIGP
jgi:fructosamine-3-kinase